MHRIFLPFQPLDALMLIFLLVCGWQMTEASFRRHRADCLGVRDEFSGGMAIALLGLSWAALFFCVATFGLPPEKPPKLLLVLAHLAGTAASASLAIVTSMITMPGCGGVQLDLLRAAIRQRAHATRPHPFFLFLHSLLPTRSNNQCCQ